MSRKEQARNLYLEGLYCSQAVLAVYCDEVGLSEEQALKTAQCFNSGMRKGEVCGACSGALLVLGMLYGQTDRNDSEARKKANEKAETFLETFRKENGSFICRELLGCDISTPDGVRYAAEHRLFSELCPGFVESAVEILEKTLQ